MRKTKIVITVGPATSSLEMIKKLIKKGVNVFRLNFSHGDHKTHENTIKTIRQASKELNKEVPGSFYVIVLTSRDDFELLLEAARELRKRREGGKE